MDRRRLNGRNSSHLQQSEAEQSSGIHLLDDNEIKELYASYNRMKAFSEQIPSEPGFNLNQILEEYAQRPLEFDLLPKNVMHILDKRIQRMLKNKKIKKNWSTQDVEILCWTVSHYFHQNNIDSIESAKFQDWEKISNLIPGTTGDSCMFKILSFKKTRLSKKKWTLRENALLLQIAESSQNKNWRKIAEELYKKNQNTDKIFRNAKQCKEHWFCYLNPELKKGSWSVQQDKKLMTFIYENKGLRKWAQIARKFGGRTQNALKNRYTLIMERLRRIEEDADEMFLIKRYLKEIQQRQEIQRKRKDYKQLKRLQYQKLRLEKFSQQAKTVQRRQQKKEKKIQTKLQSKQQQKEEKPVQVAQQAAQPKDGEVSQLTANNIQLIPTQQMNSNLIYYMVFPYSIVLHDPSYKS